MDNFNENNQQKFMIVVYIEIIYKNMFARFWCYRVYKLARSQAVSSCAHLDNTDATYLRLLSPD